MLCQGSPGRASLLRAGKTILKIRRLFGQLLGVGFTQGITSLGPLVCVWAGPLNADIIQPASNYFRGFYFSLATHLFALLHPLRLFRGLEELRLVRDTPQGPLGPPSYQMCLSGWPTAPILVFPSVASNPSATIEDAVALRRLCWACSTSWIAMPGQGPWRIDVAKGWCKLFFTRCSEIKPSNISFSPSQGHRNRCSIIRASDWSSRANTRNLVDLLFELDPNLIYWFQNNNPLCFRSIEPNCTNGNLNPLLFIRVQVSLL